MVWVIVVGVILVLFVTTGIVLSRMEDRINKQKRMELHKYLYRSCRTVRRD